MTDGAETGWRSAETPQFAAQLPAIERDALEAMLFAAADWVWETDASLRFSFVSPSYHAVTGIDPTKIIGKYRFDFLKSGQRDKAALAHLDDLQNRRPFRDFVYELKDARPEARYVATTGFPRFDTAGAFLGYRGTGRNVTALSQSVAAKSVQDAAPDQLAGGCATARLTAALDLVSEAFCFFDADDRLIYANAAFSRVYNRIADIIRPGMHVHDLIDAGLSRGFFDIGGQTPDEWRAAVLAGRSSVTGKPTMLTLADGRRIRHRSVKLPEGGSIGVCADVTESEARETALEMANRQWRKLSSDLESIIDAMPMGILVIDDQLKIEFINRSCRAIWCMPDIKVPVGSSFTQFLEGCRAKVFVDLPEAKWQRYVARRIEELRSEAVAELEFRLQDNRILTYSTATLAGGKRLICYYDVTDLKARESELAESRERNRLAGAVMDSIRDPIFVKDEDMRYVFVNQAFATLSGHTPGSMLGKTAADFVPPDLAQDFERSERDVIDTGKPYEIEENFPYFGMGDARIVRKTLVETETSRRYVAGFLLDITEQKRRENEASAARHHLASVLDSMPAAVIMYDPQDRLVFANLQMYAQMPAIASAMQPGLLLDEAFRLGHAHGYFRCSGDEAVDGLYDDDLNEWIAAMVEKYHRRQSVYERLSPDGRWYQVFDTRTPDGTFVGVRVDITELKRREDALRKTLGQLDLLSQVLDELPVAVNIKGLDLKLEYVNKSWCALTGLAKDEAVGRTDMDIFGSDEANGFTADDANVSATGAGMETEETVTHRDGTVRQLMTRKGRLTTRSGSTHLFGSSTEIDDLKDRETLLRRSLRDNEVFRSMIDNLPVAIYAKRTDLRIDYVNKGWSELTGFAREFAVGRTDVDIFGEEGIPFLEADKAILASGGTHEFEESVTATDGQTRHQFATKSAFTASDGTVYLLGSTIDVTESREREIQLREAQLHAESADRAKSEFLANMSHEIRTPMNGVLGMAELLARSELTPKQRTFTDIIVKSGNALLTIINDILDFSKIDAGQLQLDLAPFGLAEAIEDVATLVSTRAREKDLELIVRYSPDIPAHFVGDVGRIRQIITNLVGNAVKFTEVGHVLIDIGGELRDGVCDLAIRVEDTGIGIPRDKLGLVFEKFSQVDASATRRHEGTGLGLAITSRLVDLMGGKITVSSVEGRGSVFAVTMALPAAAEQSRRKAAPLDLTGARVLIVDDNAVNRSILKEQMQSWKLDACAARTGEEGLEVLHAATALGVRVDCIVLDYQMPGMTGIETAQRIRSLPQHAGTPIVLLTSVDQSLALASDEKCSIDAQLVKPARSSTLLDTLVDVIQKRRMAKHPWADTARPVLRQEPDAKVDEDSEPDPQRPGIGSRLDILVAEDNEVNQLVFTQILADTGLTFQIVSNGKLAVEAFREMQPLMLLMDVSMPEMSGLEATTRIREIEGDRHTPIVGVTAHALKGDRERCLESGMDDYLPKPISPRALHEKIARWCTRPTPEAQTA